jgi:hypothetical protein
MPISASLSKIVFLAAAFLGSGMGIDASAQPTNDDAAIVAIDAAITSLQQQPNQFVLNVTATGLSSVVQGGGTGVSVTAQGGGPNSQTTGMVVNVDSGRIEIAKSAANAALEKQAEQAIKLLSEIKAGLQLPTVDKPTIRSKLQEFGQTYVVPVLQAVIQALVLKKIG